MFGENLAELRKESGYDQKKLGELLGVSYHTISSYERGRSQPNHEMLIRIAKLFDVSLDYLLGLRRDRVCREPQMAEPEPVSGQSLSLQAVRLTNEINQMLNQREVEPDRLLPLILECAAEKYKTCRIRESDHVTFRLLALFQEHTEDKELDQELFEQTVKQVILQSDGSLRLRLVNDMVI